MKMMGDEDMELAKREKVLVDTGNIDVNNSLVMANGYSLLSLAALFSFYSPSSSSIFSSPARTKI